MLLTIKLICLVFLSKKINGLNCAYDVMKWSKKNFTDSKDSEINFTALSSEFDHILEYDKWNQVIKDNTTRDRKDVPYYVVPEITSYERGK